MTKQQRLYGKLLVDFANAKSSDEACLITLGNMRDVFGFSPGFAERAKKVLPKISAESESELKALWNKHDEILQFLKDKLIYQYEVVDADYMEQTLTIAELHSVQSDEWDPDTGEAREIPVREIAEISDKIDPEMVERLVGVWNQMYLLIGHKQIDSTRKDLRSLLEQVIEGENLYKNQSIKKLLSVYDEMNKPKLAITKDGALIEEHVFSEDSYLATEAWQPLKWPRLYEGPLAYCLINFLRSGENINYIRRCKECSKYWITRTKRPQKFCGNRCRLGHHNRRYIKSGKAAAYKRKKREEGAKESYYG